MLPTVASALDRAGTWFLRSGIQDAEGGVARYHSVAQQRNMPVSNEITGYGVSGFAYLFRQTGETEYREAALRSARFLSRTAWRADLEALPFENSEPTAPAYFFDCGIVVRGLLSAYRLSSDSEFLDVAVKIGRFMGRAFRRSRFIEPIVALPSLEPMTHELRWSRTPGCYQLKSAMAWDGLAAYFPEAPFRKWYEEAIEDALHTWESFVPGEPELPRVMDRLHALCYFIEGALPRLERPEVARALEQAIAKTGYWFDRIAPEFERSDVCAQLLRARLYVRSAVPVDEAAAAGEARRLEGHQMAGVDAMTNHGFRFATGNVERPLFMNPVSTCFGMQALEQWRQYQAGTLTAELDDLI